MEHREAPSDSLLSTALPLAATAAVATLAAYALAREAGVGAIDVSTAALAPAPEALGPDAGAAVGGTRVEAPGQPWGPPVWSVTGWSGGVDDTGASGDATRAIPGAAREDEFGRRSGAGSDGGGFAGTPYGESGGGGGAGGGGSGGVSDGLPGAPEIPATNTGTAAPSGGSAGGSTAAASARRLRVGA